MTKDVYTIGHIKQAVGVAREENKLLCAEMLGALEEILRVQGIGKVRRDHLGKGILECLDGLESIPTSLDS